MDALEVECLPTDLPERITVDISSIKEIGNNIRVHDIVLPNVERVSVLDDADDIVIIATVAKEEAPEEVVAVPGAEVVAAAPGLSVERGKKDEEAAAEKEKK
jgi:large subunit ribosomal protein L25